MQVISFKVKFLNKYLEHSKVFPIHLILRCHFNRSIYEVKDERKLLPQRIEVCFTLKDTLFSRLDEINKLIHSLW